MTSADSGALWQAREDTGFLDLLILCDLPDLGVGAWIDAALHDIQVRQHWADPQSITYVVTPSVASVVAVASIDDTATMVQRLSRRTTAGSIVALLPDDAGPSDIARVEQHGACEVLTRGEMTSRVGRRLLARVVAEARERNLADDWKLAARDARQRFRSLLDNHVDGIVVVDSLGLCHYANAAAHSLLIGRSIGLVGQTIGIPLAGAQDTELDVVGADGERHVLSLRVMDTTWEGRPVRLATLRDVTHRVRAAELIRASEHRLRAVVNTMLDGMVIADNAGTVRGINPAAERLLGYTAEELVGKSLDILVPVSLSGQLSHKDMLAAVPDDVTGTVMPWREVEARCKDCSLIPVQLGVSVVERTSGAEFTEGERLFVGVLHDIREQKAAEAAILSAKAQAEIANRTKSEFLANMSHELRTPLNAIIGFAELIRDRSFGDADMDRYSDYGKDIFDSGHHLLRLINDILDMSRIDAGAYTLNESVVRIAGIVRSCFVMAGVRARSALVNLYDEVPEHLPSVRGDARAINQVLLNLLSNAVKFTPAGGRVKVTASVAPEGSLWVSVSDTGIGIAADAIPMIMTPFGQVREKPDRVNEGAGLGLPISSNLLELHGGRLQIDSVLGKGTTVHCIFPEHRLVLQD